MAAHARSAPRGGPETDPLEEQTRKHRRHFVLRRLHSLSGVIPVGAFLVVHLWTNAKAVSGPTCFANDVAAINHLPFLVVIELFGIFLPLAFHAIYGVALAWQTKPNVGAYGYGRNWMYVLQRVTGVLAFAFLVVHLKDFRLAKALGVMGYPAFFTELSNLLTVKWRALFYLFGTTAAVFHFANGVRTFLFGWGVTVSERSQRATTWAVAAFGLVLWMLGANTVLFFATGGSMLIPTSLVRGEGGRDACEGTLTAPSSPAAEPQAAGAAP